MTNLERDETPAQQAHIGKTFFHYAERLPEGRFPRDNTGVLHILSVGFYPGTDAQPIIDVFANSMYKGIDIEPAFMFPLLQAEAASDNIIFAEEDATLVDPGEKEKYGLVVIRHPQIYGTALEVVVNALITIQKGTFDQPRSRISPTWKRIFEASVQKLTPNGYMFITTMSDSEMEATTALLQDNKVDILIHEENAASKFTPRINIFGGFADQFIVVGRKKL